MLQFHCVQTLLGLCLHSKPSISHQFLAFIYGKGTGLHMPQLVCGGQRTPCKSQFSLSAARVLGIYSGHLSLPAEPSCWLCLCSEVGGCYLSIRSIAEYLLCVQGMQLRAGPAQHLIQVTF